MTRTRQAAKAEFIVKTWVQDHRYNNKTDERPTTLSPCTVVVDLTSDVVAPNAPNAGNILKMTYIDLVRVYGAMIGPEGPWIAAFYRGKRNKITKRRTIDGDDKKTVQCLCPFGVRRLAQSHFQETDVDGWNVICGAVELARVWALKDASFCTRTDSLDRNTRAKLAVCLILSWKFQRANMSHLACTFHTPLEEEDEDDDDFKHKKEREKASYELAYICFNFFFADEQLEFGPWSRKNQLRIMELQTLLLEMEVELLCKVGVFTILTEHPQVAAEWRIDALFRAEVFDAVRSMEVRALIPFFVRVAVFSKTYDPDGSNSASEPLYTYMMRTPEMASDALTIASILCLSCSMWKNQNYVRGLCTYCFSEKEMELAKTLLTSALFLSTDELVRTGCFKQDSSWPLANSLELDVLREAGLEAAVTAAHMVLHN